MYMYVYTCVCVCVCAKIAKTASEKNKQTKARPTSHNISDLQPRLGAACARSAHYDHIFDYPLGIRLRKLFQCVEHDSRADALPNQGNRPVAVDIVPEELGEQHTGRFGPEREQREKS